ncbi:MAG: LysM peptidoglycan-binding domain-containing protein [Bacteriovoracaceae bacterium]|jgi:hypothetical protein|nr:LysM peptidoglycan-binding domain-containing protein [Bacteriovoracaceae bacterium]
MNLIYKNILIILALLSVKGYCEQINADDLVLDDPEDIKLLLEEFPQESGAGPVNSNSKKVEMVNEASDLSNELNTTVDDLDFLKDDLKDAHFALPEEDEFVKKVDEVEKVKKTKIVSEELSSEDKDLFDVGSAEKNLLEIASKMKGKIDNKVWHEIASQTTQTKYKVVKGDWLWKISQRFFGSGFYYAKIWQLNSYITNPHEIEPGMILLFTSGSQEELPTVTVATGESHLKATTEQKKQEDEFAKWGTSAKPTWITQRQKLIKDGAFVQYSTGDTLEDLDQISSQSLISEYESYDPPAPDFNLEIPSDEYDKTGFDKESKVAPKFKEGFYLNTFISTNIVQDFGKVVAAIDEKSMFTKHDKVYVTFDENIEVAAGDKFSIYSAAGKLTHENSDRQGYKYTIVGSIQLVQKHQNRWECTIIDSSGIINREDRITVYTPKIERITRTFNNRLVEAVIIGSFNKLQEYASFGDVVYLDRGRADGVEMGNVFEVYGFKDRGTAKNITDNPTYKNGELTVISLTDNFATALVTLSKRDFKVGEIAITKTKKAALKELHLKKRKDRLDDADNALDELDVELNLDDLNDDLLNKADSIKFTEDELAELERQEREKSIISDNEKDLRSLENLEKEITTAEAMLNQARLDEDKLLEGQNLDGIEKKLNSTYEESLDEIEENFGKLYLDEDLNDKDNPYGLTEFDIEEIDELLNIEGELGRQQEDE